MKREEGENTRLWIAVGAVALIAGLLLRLSLVRATQTPGHGDSAFYYTVAKNIAAGRGPVIDYIVYFFDGLLPLPHYAGDFWNPGAAYIIALPILLLGANIRNALLASVLAGIVPPMAAYFAGRYYARSMAVGVLAAILTFFIPFQVMFSVTTEAIIFAGAFGSIALLLMMKASASPRYYLLAAVFTGFANLIRQDYILLLLALETAVLLASLGWKHKLVVGVTAAAIHVLVLSPLLVQNYARLGVVFPSGPGKTAFLTTYEDFHSYNKTLDWNSLRATWGIQGIIKRRLHTASENLGQVEYFLDPALAALGALAIAEVVIVRRRLSTLRPFLPVLVFAVLEYCFYSFVASFSGPGSLIKCLAALTPFMCVLIADSLARYVRPVPVLISAVVLLSAYFGYQGFRRSHFSATHYNAIYERYEQVRSIILDDGARQGLDPRKITVLARDTWDVYEGTGFKTVMIPNNDLETILLVARHYDARYILLPAPRKALEDIYMGTTPDARFAFAGEVVGTNWRVLRLDFAAP